MSATQSDSLAQDIQKLYAIQLPDGSIAMSGPYVLATENEGQAGRMAFSRDGEVLTFARESTPGSQVVDESATPLYYLQDSRSYVGNCPQWWCPDGNGYTTRLDEAAKFSLAEAMRQHASRDTDLPWPCSDIDAIRRPTVDMQDMRSPTTAALGKGEKV